MGSTDLFDEKKVTIVPDAPCPLLPPLPAQHQTLKQPILAHPKAIRRHSIALYNLSMQQTLSSPDETISAGPRQFETSQGSFRYPHGRAKITNIDTSVNSSRQPQPQQVMSTEMPRQSVRE